MNIKPILITHGEPNSVFLEIFFKSLRYKKFKRIVGLDISHNMISESKKQNLKNSKFFVSDIEQISDFENLGKFDYVTSKRCLINLLSSKKQFLVINHLLVKFISTCR